MAAMAAAAAAAGPSPPRRPAVGPGQYVLLRFLAAVLVLGVFSTYSSQISVSNDVQALVASSAGGLVRLDGSDLAVHVAEEKGQKIERLERQIASLRARLEEEDNSSAVGGGNTAGRNSTDANAILPNSAELCKLLPQPVPDAAYIWNQHLADIHQSMRHGQDDGYVFHDLTAHILHLLTPIRLQRSRLTPPTDYEHVGQILEKAQRRYVYYQQHKASSQRKQTAAGDEQRYERIDDRDKDAPPPVSILVMVCVSITCTYRHLMYMCIIFKLLTLFLPSFSSYLQRGDAALHNRSDSPQHGRLPRPGSGHRHAIADV